MRFMRWLLVQFRRNIISSGSVLDRISPILKIHRFAFQVALGTTVITDANMLIHPLRAAMWTFVILEKPISHIQPVTRVLLSTCCTPSHKYPKALQDKESVSELVPSLTGLGLVCPFTQHSAFGYVLG